MAVDVAGSERDGRATADLETRFAELWGGVATSPPADEYRALAEAYAEPHRAYHDLAHVADCFAQLDAAPPAGRPEEVELALFFHDVVYRPRSSRNEEASAEWATRALARGDADPALVARVRELILATRHDAATAVARDLADDAALVVDVDLSILGRSPGEYDRYERAIRREYRWVPSFLYRRKRAEILRSFLDRPAIYVTPFFRERYEAVARENLRRAVAAL